MAGDVVNIGQVPWTTEEMVAAFSEFKAIYKAKPIADNQGGMKAPHAFLTWFMLKHLSPQLVVESGVWRGQGTWLIEQACPDAEIVCLDIDFSRLEYRSSQATYFEKDFSLIDFTGHDLANAIAFFDDHQNALMRLQQMHWKGFPRAIFEDNYPPKKGDCYSLKKIWMDSGFEMEQITPSSLLGRAKSLLTNSLCSEKKDAIQPNSTHRRELANTLKTYYEGPPLFKESQTRWGDNWDDDIYPTPPPLFDASKTDDLREEATHYTWMCFVELR